jgi:hypothetical protein
VCSAAHRSRGGLKIDVRYGKDAEIIGGPMLHLNRTCLLLARLVSKGAAFVIAASASAGPLYAQLTTAEDSVVVAATRHITAKHQAQGVVFDPRIRVPERVHGPDAFAGPHSDVRLAELRRQLGVRIGLVSDVITCAERKPSSCQLNSASLVIAAAAPHISGDTAMVTISSWVGYPGAKRAPIVARDTQLVLLRTADGWRVTEERLERIT